jgi:hypothetical protein
MMPGRRRALGADALFLEEMFAKYYSGKPFA